MLKGERIKLGIVGTGRIAQKFMGEVREVPEFDVVAAYNPRAASVSAFCSAHDIEQQFTVLEDMLSAVDAAYIASPHITHFEYSMLALSAGVHVLCEKPVASSAKNVHLLYEQARASNVVFLDGIKTAYYPAFSALEEFLKSGRVGEVVDVEASFTKLLPPDLPELSSDGSGGSMTWLSSYPLYTIARIMGMNPQSVSFYSLFNDEDVDIFTRGVLGYERGSASFKVGFGAKTDGNMVVTGTRGFVVVPAPWWNMRKFQVRFEDPTIIEEYEYEFEGYGLRYEIAEFVRLIHAGASTSERLTEENSVFMAKVLEEFRDAG